MKRLVLFFVMIFNVNTAVTMDCYSYNKREDSVYYACKKIEEADTETFQIIGFFSVKMKSTDRFFFFF